MADENKEFQSIEDFLNNEPTSKDDTEAAANDDADSAGDTSDTDTVATTTEAVADDKDKDKTKTTETKVVNKKPEVNPMKELRDKMTSASKMQEKIDGAINRLSDGEYNFKLKDFKNEQGKLDYDALIKAMDEADVKQRAETRGLTPELQAEIEKYEREKKEVEIAKARVQMDRQLNNFQMEQQLTPDQLNSFISDSMKVGINPLAIAALDKTSKGTVALQMLYKAVYTDKIVNSAVEKAVTEAKAKWEADLVAKGTQPKVNPAQANNSKTTKTDPKGLALDAFLNTLNN